MRRSTFMTVAGAAAALAGCALRPAGEAPERQRIVAAESERITNVLRGLRPPIEVRGEPVRWMLEERMRHHNVPGVSIAVIENGGLAWARALGVREAGSSQAVTPTTLFQAGSISKPITATALLRLVELGTLDLDSDVNRYLKSWQLPETRFTQTEPATLRRLVTHKAGVTVHGFRGYRPGMQLPTLLQVLTGAAPANNPPIVVDTVPGSTWRYSGGGFVVLQQMLMDVTGKPFEELMNEFVLRPAGMQRSTFAQPLIPALASDAARGHDPSGAVVLGGWHVLPEQAAAGLWTTASNLALWATALADAYAGRSTLLSPGIAKQMLTPDGDGVGLGLPVSGTGREFTFGHSGANVGFVAVVRMYPEAGVGVAVMTNGANGSALAQEVMRAVAAEYDWPGLVPAKITRFGISREAAEGLVGKYLLRIGPGRPVEVQYENETITLHGPGNMIQPLVPESNDRFVNVGNGWRVEFIRDGSGLAIGIRVYPDPGSPPVEGERTVERSP